MFLKLFFLLFSFSLYAREVPVLSGPVVDEANLLSNSTKNSLESLLYRYKSDTSNQVQILIIDSLEGDAIENFSIQVTDKWKLGDEKKDNGVLFLIAVKDRKMRIEVGQGLEGDLPDVLAGRIIEALKPYFKSGNFDEGIYLGTELIVKSLKGDTTAIPAPARKQKRLSLIHLFLIILFMLWIMINKFFSFLPIAGGRGYSSRGGGFGGFGGGGGGWSGGGGGFSGGGSSGSW